MNALNGPKKHKSTTHADDSQRSVLLFEIKLQANKTMHSQRFLSRFFMLSVMLCASLFVIVHATGCEGWEAIVSSDDLDKIKSMFPSRCNVNIKDDFGTTPLMMAAKSGYVAIAQYLLDNKATVDMKSSSTNSFAHCSS